MLNPYTEMNLRRFHGADGVRGLFGRTFEEQMSFVLFRGGDGTPNMRRDRRHHPRLCQVPDFRQVHAEPIRQLRNGWRK